MNLVSMVHSRTVWSGDGGQSIANLGSAGPRSGPSFGSRPRPSFGSRHRPSFGSRPRPRPRPRVHLGPNAQGRNAIIRFATQSGMSAGGSSGFLRSLGKLFARRWKWEIDLVGMRMVLGNPKDWEACEGLARTDCGSRPETL